VWKSRRYRCLKLSRLFAPSANSPKDNRLRSEYGIDYVCAQARLRGKGPGPPPLVKTGAGGISGTLADQGFSMNGLKWLIFILTFAASTAAWAQSSDLGQSIFVSSCASCHGVNGKGNGPLAAQLKVTPSDLTVIAKKNGGVFPVTTVYEVIDGRRTYTAHGTREMPVWGYLFSPLHSLNLRSSHQYTDEAIIRTRVLAVIDFLNRIQLK
jgi:mono/diheme cytochrome c family protein